jgi:two-component system, OmpR family, sensor kinase
MKIFNSIKWRLQLWYGLILVCVLAGFGFASYQLERNRQFCRVDDEIHRRIGALAQALHGPPRGQRGMRQDGPPDDFRPPPEFGGNDLPERGQRPKFNLTPQLAAEFDAGLPNQFFFVVRNYGDTETARSESVPTDVEKFFDAMPANRVPGDLTAIHRLGERQFFVKRLPSGEKILVGASIAPELRELKLTALRLAGLGGVILLLGLLGGWWFVGRSLKPILEISSTAVKISAGDLSQRISVAETQSELGKLAAVLNSTFARLETAFAQQKQFASDAAHELRTPVTVILTQTQMALSRERDAANYKQTLEACQRAAQRMRKLIDSLLELARFDAGQEMLKRMDFDFAKTISDSLEMVQTLAEEKTVKLISELSPVKISGDSEWLTQVVTNLLTNAIQYNNPNGEVRVELTSEDGLAVLKISDTGRGIAAEDLPHVFERFYRADKSRAGAGNSGLGLSICKAIVEAHGGTIEVARGENFGAVFTVRLPVNS